MIPSLVRQGGRAALIVFALLGAAPALAAEPTLPQRAAVDINAAPTKELQLVRGIGPKRAAAIIAGRPYAAPAELVARGIVPEDAYALMKDAITAGTPR